ncbi:MAG: SusC/RagA family TonB-linked outer membrane protein [Candidatus Pseudobacter hemicellulosilyticus]|uniref:SusC/RagA family TonB-linked outer membrane protein n=1 Tax=Candidatus Pseudobacter hemicellulosilyticus TaxID=3121375 RepID=A0AAJ6BEY6_9BACT|nr:MAG: SusC/RagA family TonB-linked outer membrane protein [Pseudobacter sp.]
MQKTAIGSRQGIPILSAIALLSGPVFYRQQVYRKSVSGPAFRIPAQMRRIMKLTSFLLLTFCLHVSATSSSQTITYTGRNIPLKAIFKEIKKQSGYVVLYNQQLLNNTHPVSVSVDAMPLADFLQVLFNDQPLHFRVDDRTIFLSEKPVESKSATIPSKLMLHPPALVLTGQILSPDGSALPGSSIRVLNSRKGTATDDQGRFSIPDLPEEASLEISAVGFAPLRLQLRSGTFYIVPIAGSRATAPAATLLSNKPGNLIVRLAPSTSKLDEVQVIAYGTTTRRLNTGSSVKVSSTEIAQQPVDNPLLALSGRVPGLVVTQSTGLPGSGLQVQIRGRNSISNGNDPLYIVDGVPYTNTLLPGDGYIMGLSSSAAGNPFSYLNPADIESITVLKDAGATAIYGSRGANGVILISTKKGKAGKPRVSINVQHGFGRVAKKLDLLNTRQYLDMRYEALRNDGSTPSLLNGDYDLVLWDTTRYTDWQKEFIGNTALFTDAQASLSGGNETTQFSIGAGYHRLSTVFPDNSADAKGSVHFSITNSSPDKRFNASLTGNYLVDNNQLPGMDLTRLGLTLAPDAPALYNPDGSLNWAPAPAGNSTFMNPLSVAKNTYQNKTNNLVANAVISYVLLPGITVKSSFGYTNMQTNEKSLYPSAHVSPEEKPFARGSASFVNNNISSWIIEPELGYKQMIGKGKLELQLGATIQQNNATGERINATGYPSDQVLGNMASATSLSSSGSTILVYKYNALYGRLNYNLNDEWLVDLTARRDGSSRFGRNNQFHNFGAAGIGWIFTREAFFKEQLPFLNFGKLRASYGSTGNDQIGDYRHLSLYNPVYTAGGNYQGTGGLQASRLTNPNLEWELTSKAEIALETGFLNDRLLLAVSYSHNESSNQLLSYNLPYTTGFNEIANNFPATVRNTSWEFLLNTVNLQQNQFSWTSSFNLTIPRNKLVAFPNLEQSTYASTLMIGQPLDIQQAFNYKGVDPATGLYQFASSTGDPFNPAFGTDQTLLINTQPKFYGGLQNNFRFKGFSLDFLFQFSKRTAYSNLFNTLPGMANANQLTDVLDRWQKSGDISNVQRFSANYSTYNQWGYAAMSNAGYTDVSFIRLKNASLSWELPASWTRTIHFQQARLYVQGQNLLTFTDYPGLDPENVSFLSVPPLRVITFGCQIGF